MCHFSDGDTCSLCLPSASGRGFPSPDWQNSTALSGLQPAHDSPCPRGQMDKREAGTTDNPLRDFWLRQYA